MAASAKCVGCALTRSLPEVSSFPGTALDIAVITVVHRSEGPLISAANLLRANVDVLDNGTRGIDAGPVRGAGILKVAGRAARRLALIRGEEVVVRR